MVADEPSCISGVLLVVGGDGHCIVNVNTLAIDGHSRRTFRPNPAYGGEPRIEHGSEPTRSAVLNTSELIRQR